MYRLRADGGYGPARSQPRLHVLRGAQQPDRPDERPPLHPVDQRLLQEAPQPRGGGCPVHGALQLLSHPPDPAGDALHGGRRDQDGLVHRGPGGPAAGADRGEAGAVQEAGGGGEFSPSRRGDGREGREVGPPLGSYGEGSKSKGGRRSTETPRHTSPEGGRGPSPPLDRKSVV